MAAASGRYDVVTVRSKSNGVAMWPFDLALGAISILVLVLILRFLRFDDPNPLRNAWTYLIAVPATVVIISMLLRLMSSRFVERTLQISFLLSVAIHLLFAVGALNVVLFARYWPDVFQSVTFETAPRKVVVPSYFKPASANSQVRPDYLKPVKTESEASVKEPTMARRELLSDAKAADLPTESQPDRATDPFVNARPKASPAEPEIASASADIQRQKLTQERPKALQKIDLPDLDPNVASMPEVTASKADLQRSEKPVADSVASSQIESMDATPSKLERTKLPSPRAQKEALPDLSPELATGAKLERSSAEPTARSSPQVPVVESRTETAAAATPEAREVATNRTSIAAVANSLPSNIEQREEPTPTPRPAAEMMRAPSSRIPVDAMPGDAPRELSRPTSGGKAALAPNNMATLKGPKEIESRTTSQSQSDRAAAIPEARGDKRQQTHRDTVASSISAAARDIQASNEQVETLESRSQNVPQGLSAIKGTTDGPAIQEDPSNALGSNGPKVRSRASMSGDRADGAKGSDSRAQLGAKSVPVPGDGMRETDGPPPSADAPRADLARGAGEGSRNAAIASSIEGTHATELNDASLQGGVRKGSISRGQSNLDQELTRTLEKQTGPARRGRRDSEIDRGAEQGAATGPVESREIPIPMLSNEGVDGKGDREAMLGPTVDQRQGSLRPNRGISDGSSSLEKSLATDSESNDSSTRLPNLGRGASDRTRRELPMPDVKEGDLQTQRFRREDVGGPTLAGRGVPIPTPAFQRRMDRSHESSDSENLGPLGPEVEQTIERGLAFLAANQRQDGSWHLEDFDTKVQIRSHTAATALALLAFQGAGYTHQSEKYADTVRKAIDYLVGNQRPNGDLYIRMDSESDSNAWLYSHSIAALALSEAYGMTTDPELKTAAQRAVDFMIATQDRKLGGWRYVPNSGSDTSVTGWFMMALKSAQLAGLEVKPDVFEGIKKWLDRNQASTVEPHLYRYNAEAPNTPTQQHGRLPTPIMTSIGMLMRLYTGWKRDDEPMKDAARYLLKYPPAEGTANEPLRDTYYWYYATQFFFHMGGEDWRKWNGQLQPLLVESQVLEGNLKGSWEPLGDVPDAWGRFGGRLYVTTLNLLSLEVYYRHLPLYEATAVGK